jgi:hypothetical protein
MARMVKYIGVSFFQYQKRRPVLLKNQLKAQISYENKNIFGPNEFHSWRLSGKY